MEEVQAWVTLVTAVIAGILTAVVPVAILIVKLRKAWGDADATLEVLAGAAGCIEAQKSRPGPVGKFAKSLGQEIGAQLRSKRAQEIAEDINAVVDINKTQSIPNKKRARRRAIVGGIFRALTGM